MDKWGTFYSNNKEYTFFSAAHRTFSKIVDSQSNPEYPIGDINIPDFKLYYRSIVLKTACH